MVNTNSPIRVAIIGMGGYAGAHHDVLLKLEELGQARLVATCDLRPEAFASQCERWRLASRGVRLFTDYRVLLDVCGSMLDLVVIPTPIPLHAEMHRAAVEHNIPVYLEKPPTLDPDELEAMITTDRSAPKAAAVGFNFIVEKPRLALKQRILDGEFGALREVSLLAQWPRTMGYFQRNNWAGRLISPDGRLLLDSCFANAMAHYAHNVLHWAGTETLFDWASLAEVKAELYRAHSIEGADTVFAQATTVCGVPIRVALTHACVGLHVQHEDIVLEKADIRYVVNSHYEITWRDGRSERENLPHFDALLENHLDYYLYLRGQTERPATRLEDSRPFVHFNGLNYIASGEITQFPAGSYCRHYEKNNPDNYYVEVNGLGEAMTNFVSNGCWPSETGAWCRGRPAVSVTSAEIEGLVDAVKGIRDSDSQRRLTESEEMRMDFSVPLSIES